MPDTCGPTPQRPRIAVIIPTYKARAHVLDVIGRIGPEVSRVYVVDDDCPEGSGEVVTRDCRDARVVVLRHATNQGVGGAVMTGYKAALKDGMEVLVKIDSDGQMDPALIREFVAPLLEGRADYTKGNRFFNPESIRSMPWLRLVGNAVLSLLTKLSSGYWNVFDPTNGYTAIHADVARHLPFDKISRSYFFETDMLFRLNTIRAVVFDVPMAAKYGPESSNLKVSKVVGEFLAKHLRNFGKRILYNYYLRDMSLASVELPLGAMLLFFSFVYGGLRWMHSVQTGVFAPAGTVMVAALPALLGLQLVLSFFSYDIASVPVQSLHHGRSSSDTPRP